MNLARSLLSRASSTVNILSKTMQINEFNQLQQLRTFKAEVFYHKRGLFSNETSPRGAQYKPKVMKRVKTYGLMTRLETRGGKQMLWKKILRGPEGWVRFAPAP
jgi:ribosomal protein L34